MGIFHNDIDVFPVSGCISVVINLLIFRFCFEDFASVDCENPTGNLEHLVYVKTFFPQMTNLKFSQITIFT